MILLGFPEASFTGHRGDRPKTGKQDLLYQRLSVVGLLFNNQNSLGLLVGHFLKHLEFEASNNHALCNGSPMRFNAAEAGAKSFRLEVKSSLNSRKYAPHKKVTRLNMRLLGRGLDR